MVGLALTATLACSSQSQERDEHPVLDDAAHKATSCPAVSERETIPGTEAKHLRLAYWLAELGRETDLDEVLIPPNEVSAFNAGIGSADLGRADLMAPLDSTAIGKSVRERLTWIHDKVEAGAFVHADGSHLDSDEIKHLAPVERLPKLDGSVRLALEKIPIRCGPRSEPYYKGPTVDLDFDRNSCSTIHPQEPVQILAKWPTGGLVLARTRYSFGWIRQGSQLSPPVQGATLRLVVEGDRARAVGPQTVQTQDGRSVKVLDATFVAQRPDGHLVVADTSGVHEGPIPSPDAFASTARGLTRRRVLTEAFSYLGEPYGWGGQDGGRDCSRFVQDVFEAFGLKMPRWSGHQAHAGTFTLDISAAKTDRDRMSLIDAAAKRGVVLLYFPGHIMLYLGHDDAGQPMAIHSFAEYLVPCDGGGETLFKNGDVTVTNLELGRGSSRTAFIERITQLVVIGKAPDVGLQGVAQLRAAAPVIEPETCADGPVAEIRVSPLRPNTEAPVRLAVTASEHLGPSMLTVFDERGQRITTTLKSYGGPPYGYVATLPHLDKGTYRAVFGDGGSVDACRRFKVRARRWKYGRCENEGVNEEGRPAEGDPVWSLRNRWGPRTERHFSLFIESLFDYPTGDDTTWSSLSELLADPDRNILYNHYSRHEEDYIRLQPDCADLPYFLRTYFAWKKGLPFSFRTCNRGKHGPPECGELQSNLMVCDGDNFIQAFNMFARRDVGGGVHSGSGRTHPSDDFTDYYPVPLTRDALRPGRLFADPYGHVMIVAHWEPQGIDSYGKLIAADAQPDGTIGRRRFWRGTFLFTSDTEWVGAGFKAFRPIYYRRDEDDIKAMTNATLAHSHSFTPYSEEQYQGTDDDFYDKVDALINPRPLDPFAMQRALIDAFGEAVARRVVSVDNGEGYKAKHPGKLMEMPEGYSIFETTGPWEDFATPSRDMRLLIALDTVVSFPKVVARAPARFGIESEEVVGEVERLRAALDTELKSRTFTYHRSDGTPWKLSLGDVAARSVAFEMSYNPNDCVELRWGASMGTDETSTCRDHAPDEQRARMRSYRAWFADRRRPAR